MIKTEKRPNVSLVELTRELTQMHPELFKFTGSLLETFTHQTRRLQVEVSCCLFPCVPVILTASVPFREKKVYGTQFNDAYLRAVSTKLADNVYRNIAVNLLDNMVRSLLEMTIELFNAETIAVQQKAVGDKLVRLCVARFPMRFSSTLV